MSARYTRNAPCTGVLPVRCYAGASLHSPDRPIVKLCHLAASAALAALASFASAKPLCMIVADAATGNDPALRFASASNLSPDAGSV